MRKNTYSKEELIKIITSTNLAQTSKEIGRTIPSINTIRWYYKQVKKGHSQRKGRGKILTSLLKEIAESGLETKEHSKTNSSSLVPQSTSPSSFDRLDKIFNNFKVELVDILVEVTKTLSIRAVDEAYRKGKAEGALQEQAKWVESAHRDNLGSMIERRLNEDKHDEK